MRLKYPGIGVLILFFSLPATSQILSFFRPACAYRPPIVYPSGGVPLPKIAIPGTSLPEVFSYSTEWYKKKSPDDLKSPYYTGNIKKNCSQCFLKENHLLSLEYKSLISQFCTHNEAHLNTPRLRPLNYTKDLQTKTESNIRPIFSVIDHEQIRQKAEKESRDRLVGLFTSNNIQVTTRPSKAKLGKRILYLKSLEGKQLYHAQYHAAFLNTIKNIQAAFKFRQSINIFVCSQYGSDLILHHCFFNDTTLISTFQVITKDNWSEVNNTLNFATSIKAENTLNLIFDRHENTSKTIAAKLDAAGKDFLISSVNNWRNVWEKLNMLADAESRRIDRGSLTYIDGLPQHLRSLITSGYSKNDISQIEYIRKNADSLLMQANKKITSKEEVLKEFQEGSNNVVFVVAHASKQAFYINGEKITLKELEQLSVRESQRTAPRTIILLSCQTGNINAKQGLIFKKDIKCLADILIGKKFADLVIAPTSDINQHEVVAVLKKICSGESLNSIRTEISMKWLQIVSTFPRTILPTKKFKLHEYFTKPGEIIV
jgi:hypothetical protein